jgi:hypothetical protein
MNSTPDDNYTDISYSVGKSGGSTAELFEIRWSRRGLYSEQDDESDPLVIWWARLLEKGNLARRAKLNQSYRRSRWGRLEVKPSPFSPLSSLHKQGRLINFSLCLLIFSLGLSLNVVAWSQTAESGGNGPDKGATTSQTPYSERFSRMKDFVGQHNQYLDLSKLNEFTWAEDSHIVAAGQSAKSAHDAVFEKRSTQIGMQPPAVNCKKCRKAHKSDTRLTEGGKNRVHERFDFQSDRWQQTAE